MASDPETLAEEILSKFLAQEKTTSVGYAIAHDPRALDRVRAFIRATLEELCLKVIDAPLTESEESTLSVHGGWSGGAMSIKLGPYTPGDTPDASE